MSLHREYKREVFSGWFDLRRLLEDRRKLISDPSLALAKNQNQLANSPLKFALKSIVLPAAVLSFLATIPSTVTELPPTPRERRISALEARADSTEQAAQERLAEVDSATLQRVRQAEYDSTEYDSIRAHMMARVDSIDALLSDSEPFTDSSKAILNRLDSARQRYSQRARAVIARLESVARRDGDTAAIRDTVLTLYARYETLTEKYRQRRATEVKKLDSVEAAYRRKRRLIAAKGSVYRELIDAADSVAAGLGIKTADQSTEIAILQRKVAARLVVERKIARLISKARLPIIAALIVVTAILFGWFLTARFNVTVRQGAHLHMYLSSALLFFPTIAFGLFEIAGRVVVRFPESPLQIGLLPMWALLTAWGLVATYIAARKIASVAPKKNGEKGRFDAAWVAIILVVSSAATTIAGRVLINLAAYPLSKLIISLHT